MERALAWYRAEGLPDGSVLLGLGWGQGENAMTVALRLPDEQLRELAEALLKAYREALQMKAKRH